MQLISLEVLTAALQISSQILFGIFVARNDLLNLLVSETNPSTELRIPQKYGVGVENFVKLVSDPPPVIHISDLYTVLRTLCHWGILVFSLLSMTFTDYNKRSSDVH